MCDVIRVYHWVVVYHWTVDGCTPRQHALQDRQISFSPAIDPDNILSDAMGEGFVHTEDNEVEYYEAYNEGRGTK